VNDSDGLRLPSRSKMQVRSARRKVPLFSARSHLPVSTARLALCSLPFFWHVGFRDFTPAARNHPFFFPPPRPDFLSGAIPSPCPPRLFFLMSLRLSFFCPYPLFLAAFFANSLLYKSGYVSPLGLLYFPLRSMNLPFIRSVFPPSSSNLLELLQI